MEKSVKNIYNKNISEKFSNKYNNDSIKKNGDNNKNCLDMKASDNMSVLSDKIFGKNYSCDDKLQNNNVSAANCADNISNGSYITIRIKGNGFLYNMVRIIAGTLMQVGRGQLTPDAVQNMLLSKDRCSAGQTAPPQGLTLMGIDYVDGDDKEIV
jgi:tRNA pseudouridine(38-40) synthase